MAALSDAYAQNGATEFKSGLGVAGRLEEPGLDGSSAKLGEHSMAKQMVATESFLAVVNGYSDRFVAGETIVDADHEAVRAHPDKFKPVARHAERPDVEQAT